jgi:hypothetical protein
MFALLTESATTISLPRGITSDSASKEQLHLNAVERPECFEAPKERHGRKTLATQESLNIHTNLRQAMAPPILDQAALEVLPRLQEVVSFRRTASPPSRLTRR